MTDTQRFINQVHLLSLRKLFSGRVHYSVPRYQRHYTWEASEIVQLLQDLVDALKQNRPEQNYYIGTLVVDRSSNNVSTGESPGYLPLFDVIDGQQRLTTLVLLFACLQREFGCLVPDGIGRNVLRFALRDEAQQALDSLVSSGKQGVLAVGVEQEDVSVRALRHADRIIRDWLVRFSRENDGNSNLHMLADYLADNVKILRVQLPERADPIRYFEVMNSRGEQLEAHEVLKALLLKELQAHPHYRQRLRKVWDACGNMNDVVQFDRIESADMHWDVETIKALTLRDILLPEKRVAVSGESSREDGNYLAPIIDFPNLLMHVLSVFLNAEKAASRVTVPLDDKQLLAMFSDHLLKSPDPERINRFTGVLLRCRSLFDGFIIRRDRRRAVERPGEEHWALRREEGPGGLKVLVSVGHDKAAYHRIRMLQAAFEVSAPGKSHKHWLHGALLWLYRQQDSIRADAFLQHLFTQAKAFVFERYLGEKLPYEDIVFAGANVPRPTARPLDVAVADGLLSYGGIRNNFVFNFLDYLLWLQHGEKAWAKGFEFTSRSSVEHVQPQNPDQPPSVPWSNEALHGFGNLCLITHGQNSRLGNLSPIAKLDYFSRETQSSLKYRLVMNTIARTDDKRWEPQHAFEHAQEMMSVLSVARDAVTPVDFVTKVVRVVREAPCQAGKAG